jgi:lipopolysaccharide biosynthesis glycosyltransferase
LYLELVSAAPFLPSEEAEQSALNEYFHGRWQQLPYTFNFQKHPGSSPTRLQLYVIFRYCYAGRPRLTSLTCTFTLTPPTSV